MIKIIRNTSGAPIQVLKKTLANGESFSVPYHFWTELADAPSISSSILSGDLTVNDGTSDLSPSEGVEYILRFQFDSASKISFSNSNNGFAATNAQSAIEEVRNTSVSSILSKEFSNNGTSSNTWLNNAESPLPSNRVPFVVPFDCKLIGITFTNANNSVDLDIELNIAKFNERSTTNRTLVYALRNVRTWVKTDFAENPNLNFIAGDKIGVFIRDRGNNPNDPVVTLYFKTLNEIQQTKSENHSSSFSISLLGITITIG